MYSLALRNVLIALVCSTALVACNSKSKDKPSQLAAKVNKSEITISQVKNALSHMNVPPEQNEAASRQVLERLIGRELLVEQAIKSKLDREPRIVQALEDARRDMIARAYLEQVASKVPKPTDAEIHDFYTKHPEMFAQRKVFKLRQLVVDAAAGEKQTQVKAEFDKNPRLEALAEYLKAQNIRFDAKDSIKKAEEIPQEMQARFAALKEGEILATNTPNIMVFVQVLAAQNMPVDEAGAKPHIAQYLENQKRGEAQQAELKRLKDAAKIEYGSQFASAASAPAGQAAAASKPADSDAAKGLKGL